MPQASARTPALDLCVRLTAFCLAISVCGNAFAADPPRRRPLPVDAERIERTIPQAAEPAGPEAGLGVLQRLALYLDQIFADRAATAPMAYAPSEGSITPVEFVPYSGPLAPGTVVINLDRFQVYRIREGGFAELYQERSEAAVLARVGMARSF